MKLLQKTELKSHGCVSEPLSQSTCSHVWETSPVCGSKSLLKGGDFEWQSQERRHFSLSVSPSERLKRCFFRPYYGERCSRWARGTGRSSVWMSARAERRTVWIHVGGRVGTSVWGRAGQCRWLQAWLRVQVRERFKESVSIKRKVCYLEGASFGMIEMAVRRERGKVVQVVDESHFTAPITGLCSANAVWLVLLLSLIHFISFSSCFSFTGHQISVILLVRLM